MWMLVDVAWVAIATLTLSRAKIFKPWRSWLSVRSPFMGSLVSCPYCLMHWTAMIVALLSPRWDWLEFPLLMVAAAATMALVKTAIDLVGGSSEER